MVADWVPRDIDYQRDFERFELLLSMLSGLHRNQNPWDSACMLPPFEGPQPEWESNPHRTPIGAHFRTFVAPAAQWAKDEHMRRLNQTDRRRGLNPDRPEPPQRATCGQELALAIDSNHLGNVEGCALRLWERCSGVVSGRTPLEGLWLREAEGLP